MTLIIRLQYYCHALTILIFLAIGFSMPLVSVFFCHGAFRYLRRLELAGVPSSILPSFLRQPPPPSVQLSSLLRGRGQTLFQIMQNLKNFIFSPIFFGVFFLLMKMPENFIFAFLLQLQFQFFENLPEGAFVKGAPDSQNAYCTLHGANCKFSYCKLHIA